MRPFVFVNLAMSADGKLSTRERRQVRISGEDDFLRVDQIKADSDAIMVGIGTIFADNPSLTVKSEERKAARRQEGKEENPVRIVIDSLGRIPLDAEILHKGPGQRIIAVSGRMDPGRQAELQKYADVIVCGNDDRVHLTTLLNRLGERGIRRLMVEGGGTLIWGLFEEGLVDEIITCIGNVIIGGSDAPTPVDGPGFLKESEFPALELIESAPMDQGVVLRWKVKK
ncbi:5-amino-6-(5-phosphoribosylamino)uracil reductase [Methanomicrobiaceae archaeon CYW5]|uniref:2,5-diamino-6-(ribosylamino)-4(3H)-pyrimidinone 5'-phosphate reductase n=1 Tax=Methanovulcanius yangii TaxID=1789227 RepID=UPI0029CA2845|nr:2,5-diamino-6-(ribosylamino)-4(3H)-pyrimidinone 5'-phosphate reductase [Methanovulcanius yangii]MBT8507173.1 5-amino-6-(5-phosphoribosylamino)uracil reductase [Methanovulcanius yangii]